MAQETLKITITADNAQAVKNIEQTVAATNSLGKAFKAIPNSSGQATQALTNLSRVAQDAPYGFMGIANNINPLLESFQRLQVSAGSTGGALKSMASSLMGPAGVGLAVGVVSSLIVAFGDDILALILAESAAEKQQTKLNDAMAKGAGEAAAESDRLVILNGIVSDSAKSLGERETALNAIKNAYKGNIELQKMDINDGAKLTTIINNITEALKRKALAQAFSTIIAEEEAKKVRLQLQSMSEMRKSVNGATASWDFIVAAMKNAGSVMGVVDYNVGITNKALSQNSKAITDVDANLLMLNEKYGKVIGDQVKFGDSTTLSTTALKNQASEINSSTAGLTAYINEELRLSKMMRGLNRDMTIVETHPVVPELPNKLSSKVPSFATQYEAEQTAKLAENQAKYNDQLQMAQEISSTLSGSFNNVFEAFANGDDMGKALADTFKNLLVQMVEMVAQALILKAVMSLFGLGGAVGGAGGAAGGGLLGGIGKIFGFANGGIVSKPTFAMVGEGGESEAIMPLSKLDKALGGAFASGASSGSGQQNGQFVLKGNDLVLALQRSNVALNLRR